MTPQAVPASSQVLRAWALCALLASAVQASAAEDPIFANGFESTSAQIASLRALPDGPVSVEVTSALVTYLKPGIGGDAAGFFIQGDRTGPALFVAVDPSSTSPAAQVGDRVSLRVTSLSSMGGLREAASITNYSRAASGQSITALIQDLSTASNVVTGLDQYESELISIGGTIASAFASSGSGFVAAPIETPGVSGDTNLRLRVPATLAGALSLSQGCTFATGPVPMWRFNAIAEPSPHTLDDIVALECQAPTVVSATALSANSVDVHFDRSIDAASVQANGSQFTFDNGLIATAASASGTDIVVTTNTQTKSVIYTVTVAASITDTLGTPLGIPNSAQFSGFFVPATLLLNEVSPAITGSHDLVELRATAAGSTAGITLVMNPDAGGGGTVLATLPDISVAIGDLIVVHLVPVDGSSETQSKTECIAASCYPGAWDVLGGTTGIAYSDRVLAVAAASGAITDAVAFALDDANNVSAFVTSVRYVQALGTWLPADCGGSLCDYATTPSIVSISAIWAAMGTTVGGNSIARTAVGDSNQASDWQVGASTFGAANP